MYITAKKDSDDDDEDDEGETDSKYGILHLIMDRRRKSYLKGIQKKKKKVVKVAAPEGKALYCLDEKNEFRNFIFKLV